MDNKKPDHLPVKAVLQLVTSRKAHVSRRRKPEYDRKAVRDAKGSTDPDVMEQVRGLEQHLQSFGEVPLVVEPSSHRHLLAEHTLVGLRHFFPVQACKKRSDWMSKDTFQLMLLSLLIKGKY